MVTAHQPIPYRGFVLAPYQGAQVFLEPIYTVGSPAILIAATCSDFRACIERRLDFKRTLYYGDLALMDIRYWARTHTAQLRGYETPPDITSLVLAFRDDVMAIIKHYGVGRHQEESTNVD